ncbi:Uncharacterised protein [Vibrio cholerae]|nr:Uncharacterised protein [Vibrio cholerae]CSB69846.1 Uncharacterised protein [Vibrio cholerae]CSD10927.1 Uncharacterised protein [Vibrio cholerae]
MFQSPNRYACIARHIAFAVFDSVKFFKNGHWDDHVVLFKRVNRERFVE